ncbi:MAG: putative hydro-lyase [Planctomycetaceae bacterium]|nr:putative hydro-lyase [Planctomycetaceae bacterium]
MSHLTTGLEVRRACREGSLRGPTCGLAPGFAQANLVILPADWAFDFLLFCQRNPQPCPLIEVTAPGDWTPRLTAPDADLRSDLPGYRVWQNGELVDEPGDVHRHWRDDLVSFLIGCSFTFEAALQRAGLPVRHLELGRNVPMYRTNIACQPAGRFSGPLVVSMRPLSPRDAIKSVQISAAFPGSHGAPVHLGFPDQIGITDLSRPDYGDAVPVHPHELPVFWACGVTPQAVLMQAKPPFAITHSPGKMFVTDVVDDPAAR